MQDLTFLDFASAFAIFVPGRLCLNQTYSKGCSTSHAGAISRVHGSHRLRHSGRAAHASLVDSTHTEGVGTALHQASDGETGKLNRRVIALDPVGGSDLTSVDI